jgi:hypothetical protein
MFYTDWVSECCLMPNEQFFSYNLPRTNYIEWNDDDNTCYIQWNDDDDTCYIQWNDDDNTCYIQWNDDVCSCFVLDQHM